MVRALFQAFYSSIVMLFTLVTFFKTKLSYLVSFFRH